MVELSICKGITSVVCYGIVLGAEAILIGLLQLDPMTSKIWEGGQSYSLVGCKVCSHFLSELFCGTWNPIEKLL